MYSEDYVAETWAVWPRYSIKCTVWLKKNPLISNAFLPSSEQKRLQNTDLQVTISKTQRAHKNPSWQFWCVVFEKCVQVYLFHAFAAE